MDCIKAPETIAVAGRIVEISRIIQNWLECEGIDTPVPLDPGKSDPVEAVADIAAVASRNEILRSQRDLLPASPQSHVVGARFEKTDVEESLMYVKLLVVETGPR